MKNLIKRFGIFTLTTIVLSSCGSIVGGSRFNGHIIVREHPNADIYIKGTKVGTGEAMGSFYRNRLLSVEVRQSGCEPQTQTFKHVYRGGALAGNLLVFGGVIGALIDLADGACFKPDANGDPRHIQKKDLKNFALIVDYSVCPLK